MWLLIMQQGFSLRRPYFDPRKAHEGFVVEDLTQRGFSPCKSFSFVSRQQFSILIFICHQKRVVHRYTESIGNCNKCIVRSRTVCDLWRPEIPNWIVEMCEVGEWQKRKEMRGRGSGGLCRVCVVNGTWWDVIFIVLFIWNSVDWWAEHSRYAKWPHLGLDHTYAVASCTDTWYDIQGLSKRFEHLLLWPPRSPDLTPCDFFPMGIR